MTEKRKARKLPTETLIVETFDVIKEEPIEEVEKVNIASTPKRKYTVVGIRGGNMVLVDEDGNGYMFPIGEKYKKVKISEIVYLYTF